MLELEKQDISEDKVLPQTIVYEDNSNHVPSHQEKPGYGLPFLNEQVESPIEMTFDTRNYRPEAKY